MESNFIGGFEFIHLITAVFVSDGPGIQGHSALLVSHIFITLWACISCKRIRSELRFRKEVIMSLSMDSFSPSFYDHTAELPGGCAARNYRLWMKLGLSLRIDC
jgi:hypothetical protein